MAQETFLERYTPHAGLVLDITERLYDAKSPYQRIEIFQTRGFGRMLTLDGCVMLTEEDEFVYHEMIVHPALFAHGRPERVLIIGGGDGGSVRETLRHEGVRAVTLVEIDQMVVEASRRFLPTLSAGLADPRVRIEYADGYYHLDAHKAAYDVILVDSIDPVGEAAKLFTGPFYDKVHEALRPGGVAVFETESPSYDGHILARVCATLRERFRHVAPYLAAIPTYPSGLWSFTFASDAVAPRGAQPALDAPWLGELKYFTPELFRAAFALPRFIQARVGG